MTKVLENGFIITPTGKYKKKDLRLKIKEMDGGFFIII